MTQTYDDYARLVNITKEIDAGATHIMNIMDTFDYETYEVFVYGEKDLEEKKEKYSQNMQKIVSIDALQKYNVGGNI